MAPKFSDDTVDEQIHTGRREKLRQSFMRYGLQTFNETQVIEFALGMVVPRIDTNPTAHRLRNTFGSLDGVISAAPEKLASVGGMGPVAANFLHFLKQFITYMHGLDRKTSKITCPANAVEVLADLMKTYPVEHFIVVCLDKTGAVLLHQSIRGNMDKVDLNIREITDIALRVNSASVVFAHNHVDEDINPSESDVTFTRNIIAVLAGIGITVIDHIIFGREDHYSFARNGVLEYLASEHAAFVQNHDYADVLPLVVKDKQKCDTDDALRTPKFD
jgi:DNA repair protein RadC